MARNPAQTSPRVAKIASKQLHKPNTPKPAKSTAGSALRQAPLKRKSGK